MIVSNLYYLPQASWFKEVIQEDNITMEQYDNWQKSSRRNKAIIAAANGLQTLSIPIVGGREQKSLYKDVRICYQEKWQHNHLLSIQSAYGSAPFFEHYMPHFEPFYKKQTPFLFDFNFELLQLCFRLLKTDKNISRTECYQKENPDVLRIRNLKILSESKKGYIQVFSERFGFQPDVSIIDLLFNEGNAARDYLMD
jgi:hypothetical protein